MIYSEKQDGIPDFNDLAATFASLQKGHTVEFQSAVIAALMRIEDALKAKRCSCNG